MDKCMSVSEHTGQTSGLASQALLGVVIVTYNSADVLPDLLDSLAAGLDGAGQYKVVVVDNKSSDQSVAIAQAHSIGAHVIRNSSNAGYAAGINLAATTLPADANMLILNPDIRLLPGSVEKLVERATGESIGVVVPLILNADGSRANSLRREPTLSTTWWQALLGPTLASRIGLGEMITAKSAYDRGRSIDWATGAILLVAARARRRIGDWDESFFLYSEEVDYQRRVRSANLQVVFVPEAQVFHAGGDYKQSSALTSIMASNQIRYFARHHRPMSTAMFRGALATFGLLRVWRSSAHRAVLKVALSPLQPARNYVRAESGK